MGDSRMPTCVRSTFARRPSGCEVRNLPCVFVPPIPAALDAEQLPASGSPRTGTRRKVDSLGGAAGEEGRYGVQVSEGADTMHSTATYVHDSVQSGGERGEGGPFDVGQGKTGSMG